MKNTKKHKDIAGSEDDFRPEYRFDYRKAKPNRFAAQAAKGPVVVMLDSDVSTVFRTPDSVNSVLRALIETMPPRTKRKKTRAVSEHK
jgi:hypothetical protein